MADIVRLKEQNGRIFLFRGAQFPFLVRIVEASFSAVFHAYFNARILYKDSTEMWRREHDNLFVNFFIRESDAASRGPVMTRRQRMDASRNQILEDPSVHPA